VAET
jgi:hypothetical protein